MNIKITIFFLFSVILIAGCGPVKNQIQNQYTLDKFYVQATGNTLTSTHIASKSSPSIIVTPPEALSGYDTTDMLYVEKAYSRESFAHNAWASPPNNMLQSLITQSLQHSDIFSAVTSGNINTDSDYRLDTQLLTLEQNFLTRPSQLIMNIKFTLVDQSQNKIVGSAIFREQIPCTQNSPYAGVIAANTATYNITHKMVQFIAKVIH